MANTMFITAKITGFFFQEYFKLIHRSKISVFKLLYRVLGFYTGCVLLVFFKVIYY